MSGAGHVPENLTQVLVTTYSGAKAEELEPYFFTALRPLVPVCICGANASLERQVDPSFLNMKVVGHNWADRLACQIQ